MFLFPLAYILSFLYGAGLLLQKQVKGLLVFSIFGLPLYTHALSISFMLGFANLIPFLQSCKEIIMLLGLITVISGLKQKPKLHLIDKLIGFFFLYTLIYTLLPIGGYSFTERLLAFKSISTVPLIYFIGRFCVPSSINLNKMYGYICTVSILAAGIVLLEFLFNRHLHTQTGFIDFQIRYYNGETSGNYGLSWTFETESGHKRFGSIYNSPLEFANATIIAVAAALALSYKRKYERTTAGFYGISLLATLICIILAISRAPMANYIILIFCFALITNNHKLLKYFSYAMAAIVIYVAFFLRGDLFDFIVATLNFQSSSSLGHLLEWLKGIEAIISHPFGMGIGTSGLVAANADDNVGGENQLIIIGVQAGVIIILVYSWTYIQLIRLGLRTFRTTTGKSKRLGLFVVLIKIGLVMSLLTSYLDSSNYITYISYFFSGLLVNMVMARQRESKRLALLAQQTKLGLA